MAMLNPRGPMKRIMSLQCATEHEAAKLKKKNGHKMY